MGVYDCCICETPIYGAKVRSKNGTTKNRTRPLAHVSNVYSIETRRWGEAVTSLTRTQTQGE